MSNTFKKVVRCDQLGGGVVMEDREFNRRLERILEVIYRVEAKPRKQSETQPIKYGNEQPRPSGKYPT